MEGQRVIIKVHHPRGLDNFPIDLQGTKGTIVASISTGGSMIVCDADRNPWAFDESEYEVIDSEEREES